MATKNKSNEIKIIRLFDAPLKMVWDAWHDPEQVKKWWGPRGFTLTHHGKDLKPGGFWKYTMHGPDGKDWPNKTIYHEIEPYKRLVYDHGGSEDTPPLFRLTALFSEVGKKTKIEMSMTFATPEIAAETRKFIKKAGGDTTWDRFAEYLVEQTSGKDIFVINRSFDAPINLMFDLWTKPEHIEKWTAPTGMNMKYFRADIRPGGSSFYEMNNGKDVRMFGTAKYLEIERPNRIVYTQQFVDEKENVSRHPHAPTWPETMLTTITLTEEGPDRTRVTIRWEVHGNATAAEREMFNKAKAGMSQGWTGSLDKLEAYIDEQQ